MNKIKVIIDRPKGSKHPKHDILYEVNYGYVEGIIAPDGEEQDAYVLGVDEPIEYFEGSLIAVVKRYNDIEDKWVIANRTYTAQEIKEKIYFQEQYFDFEIHLIK